MRRRYSKDKKFVQIVEQMLDSGFNPWTDTPEEIEEDSEYAVADDLSSYYGISEKQAIYFVWTLLEDFVKKVIKGDREEKELLYGDDDYDYTPSRNKGRPQTRFVGTPDITVIDVKGFVRWVEKTFGVSEFPIKSYRTRKDPSDFDSRRRYASNRRRAYGDYEDHEYFSYDRMSVDEYLDGLDDFEVTTPLHGTVRVRSSDKATKMALQTVKAFNQLQRASARVARIDAEYDDTQYKSDLYLEQGKYGLYSKAEKRLDALSREFDKAEKAYAKLTSKYPDLVGLKALDYEIFIWADDLEELHFDLKRESFPFSARLKDYLDIDPTEY